MTQLRIVLNDNDQADLKAIEDVDLKNISQGGKVILALCAVNAVIDCNKTDVFLWENHFTDMDKTTKPCGAADNN